MDDVEQFGSERLNVDHITAIKTHIRILEAALRDQVVVHYWSGERFPLMATLTALPGDEIDPIHPNHAGEKHAAFREATGMTHEGPMPRAMLQERIAELTAGHGAA